MNCSEGCWNFFFFFFWKKKVFFFQFLFSWKCDADIKGHNPVFRSMSSSSSCFFLFLFFLPAEAKAKKKEMARLDLDRSCLAKYPFKGRMTWEHFHFLKFFWNKKKINFDLISSHLFCQCLIFYILTLLFRNFLYFITIEINSFNKSQT